MSRVFLRRLTALCAALGCCTLTASLTAAQSVVQVERPIAFDAMGRVLVLTPSAAARWKLAPPDWPLGSEWKEARLFAADTMALATQGAVLVVQRVDGSVARYAYAGEALMRLRGMVESALLAQGNSGDGARGGTAYELSEPAGNVFVRNQTVLGLIAYGPATAAIFSSNGAAAGGGYLLAAGSSFFIAAKTVRDRSVSRAQTLLAFHGGIRGSIAGAAVAAITERDGGAGYGAPILIGAVGGTVAGFRGARGMSDGEAASSGFGADLGGLTTLGLSGAFGLFEDDTATRNQELETRGKVALGAGIAAAAIGYAVGPRYARRSAYNVTAGDIDVGFTSAVIGALGVNALLPSDVDSRTRFAVSTGGLLLGAFAADRTKIRHGDRTSADGTLVQLGAIAGALMGGGFAVITDMNAQATVGAFAVGGALGMVGADAIVRPARDAGPKRGVLPSDGGFASGRVSLSLVPAVTQLALGWKSATTPAKPGERVRLQSVPVMRVAF
jgi:hypothetical protein